MKSVQSTGIGRAPVIFFSHNGLSLVLRHYYRGGLVARFIQDWYLGVQLKNTRAYREWCLLRTMRNLNLPVPVPVAARVLKKGIFYQADLVTVEIQQSETLADYLMQQELSEAEWGQVGQCIKRFHAHNIYHADLNARNILLKKISGNENEVYLIDFDRGNIRHRSGRWQQENLGRLKRSLEKFKERVTGFNYNDHAWTELMTGYDSGWVK